jgi:hypothetical protein
MHPPHASNTPHALSVHSLLVHMFVHSGGVCGCVEWWLVIRTSTSSTPPITLPATLPRPPPPGTPPPRTSTHTQCCRAPVLVWLKWWCVQLGAHVCARWRCVWLCGVLAGDILPAPVSSLQSHHHRHFHALPPPRMRHPPPPGRLRTHTATGPLCCSGTNGGVCSLVSECWVDSKCSCHTCVLQNTIPAGGPATHPSAMPAATRMLHLCIKRQPHYLPCNHTFIAWPGH